MKEDGARRRAFESLLTELFQGSPSLVYRDVDGRELADRVWERFSKKCFNCGKALKSAREMNLDHTRPLALLYPLDGTATALCRECNSRKRDKPPSKFYPSEKLVDLARITGVALPELRRPGPNEQAIALLMTKLDWFFDVFLETAEMKRVRDGKVTGDLVVKALVKVLAASSTPGVDAVGAQWKRRREKR